MDQRELAAEIERFRPALMRQARRLDRNDADDLLQDSILRALRRSEQFRSRSVLAWMTAIIRNTATDRRRRQARVPIPIGLVEAETLADQDTTDTRALLAATNAEGRRMIILAADGYTYREIARRCACTPHHVRYRLAEARAKIRRAAGE